MCRKPVKKREVGILQSKERQVRYVSRGHITPSPSGSKNEQCCSRTCYVKGVSDCYPTESNVSYSLMLVLLCPIILLCPVR